MPSRMHTPEVEGGLSGPSVEARFALGFPLMDASAVPNERVPWTVRFNTYLAPHRVPAGWREWALREIRSRGWVWRSMGWQLAIYVPLLLLFAKDGLSYFEGLLVFALVGPTVGIGWFTRNFRRRRALAALEGERVQDVRMRPWDLPLALGLGAVAVVLMLLFAP